MASEPAPGCAGPACQPDSSLGCLVCSALPGSHQGWLPPAACSLASQQGLGPLLEPTSQCGCPLAPCVLVAACAACHTTLPLALATAPACPQRLFWHRGHRLSAALERDGSRHGFFNKEQNVVNEAVISEIDSTDLRLTMLRKARELGKKRGLCAQKRACFDSCFACDITTKQSCTACR